MATNDGGHVIDIFMGSTADEMAALDQLGPLTRQAIYNSPIRYAATPVLQQVRDYEKELQAKAPPNFVVRLDPKDPRLDAALAKGLIQRSIEIVMKDRSEQDAKAGVVPLVPKIGVKSIREQRRTLRRIRW